MSGFDTGYIMILFNNYLVSDQASGQVISRFYIPCSETASQQSGTYMYLYTCWCNAGGVRTRSVCTLNWFTSVT